jgi:hypothetical protein
MRLRRLFLAVLAGGLLFGIVSVPNAMAVGSFTTVVTGLDNPRDLAFSPDGRLFVAEAGSGGAASDCVAGGPGGAQCPGFTSGVSVVDTANGKAHRVVSGLASISDTGGAAAVGLDGISFAENGKLFGIMGESQDGINGVFPDEITDKLGEQLGRLITLNDNGTFDVVADVGHADFQWSTDNQSLVPDQFPDANPYGVVAVDDILWVADAASNTVDRVEQDGDVSVKAFIPNPPVSSDAVPTCIDRGPDGAFYIGQLTGGGNPPGSASVWRFAPGEENPLSQWATGLTAVTGCGFGSDGQFYAAEFSTLGLDNAAPGTGEVVRVPPHSTSPTTVADGLSFPGGFAAGSDGSLYVSNWSIAPAASGMGAVVRIVP